MLAEEIENKDINREKKEFYADPYNCLLNVFGGLFESKKKYSTVDNINKIIEDNGNGPVSKGMIFLELISSCVRRENTGCIENLDFPKDAPIIDFLEPESIDENKKADAIIQSLGIESVVDAMRNIDIDKHFILVSAMRDVYDRVSEGTFYRRSHRVLLPYLKNCAKLCKSKGNLQG